MARNRTERIIIKYFDSLNTFGLYIPFHHHQRYLSGLKS